MTQAGYTFIGWNTAENGSGTSRAAGSTFTMGTENVLLYAQWIENQISYTVTFETNGGSSIDVQTIVENGKVAQPENPTKNSCLFVDWYKEPELTTIWDFTTDMVTKNITLYSKWNIIASIGILHPSGVDFWDSSIAEFEKLAEIDSGITLKTYLSNDIDEQKAKVEQWIIEGVNVLIITTWNTDDLKTKEIVTDCVNAGINVICHDILIRDTTGIDFYTTFDSIEIGKIQGNFIADNTEAHDTILVVQGSSVEPNALLFRQGAMEILQPIIDAGNLSLFDGSILIATDWDPESAYNLINGYNKTTLDTVDAILSPNDGLFLSYNGIGGDNCIYKALLAKGYSETEIEFLVITGQDGTAAAITAIDSSPQIMDMTIIKDPKKLAKISYDATKQLVQGLNPETNTTVNNGSIDVPANTISGELYE